MTDKGENPYLHCADKEEKEECAVECMIEIFCVCISDDPSRMTQN